MTREAAAIAENGDDSFDPAAMEAAEPDIDKEIHTRTLDAVHGNPDRFVNEYLRYFGRVLNADNASELFDDYRLARATRVKPVRAAAGRVVEGAFERLTAEPVAEGRLPLAVFTSGGNASGKSTGIDNRARAHLVFDSTLSQLEPSVAKIERALAAGLDVRIRHVRRDPVDAWRAVLERARENGRTVTLEGHLTTH
ncbi:MAG: hypothetical protein LC791_19370, partial [Acidobacteria bacterium]|nr:hypothetical protein [Acidobacteriota bacterium]